MSRRKLVCFVTCALAVIVSATVSAETYLDQRILPKYGRLKAQVENQEVADEMDFEWPTTVERVNGQWLWITDDGHFSADGKPRKGWVSKNDVILLEGDPIERKSALDYFTDVLQQNPKTGWAYWLRGVIFARVEHDWPAAIEDLKQANCYAPNLDDAFEARAWSEYQQSLVDDAAIFAKCRDRDFKPLQFKDLPRGLRDALRHFHCAAELRGRPHTYREWADALAVRDWSQFQRRIFIFYLEDPAQMPSTSTTAVTDSRDTSLTWNQPSALCLYNRAIDLFPSYASGHYGRGGLYEYFADYQVYKMTECLAWKTLTRAADVKKQVETLRKAKTELADLKETMETITEEMDRLAGLRNTSFHESRLRQLSGKREAKQCDIDKAQVEVDNAKAKLKTSIDKVEKNQTALDKLQNDMLGKAKSLVDKCLADYSATVSTDPTYFAAFRDRAAVTLMMIDPTGAQPIKAPRRVHQIATIAAANDWAETAAKLIDYDELAALATLAATLNASGSYDEAIRREESAWEKMDNKQKDLARRFLELYRSNKETAKTKYAAN
jgi:tetratricopeptide (TPR) repeat protein